MLPQIVDECHGEKTNVTRKGLALLGCFEDLPVAPRKYTMYERRRIIMWGSYI